MLFKSFVPMNNFSAIHNFFTGSGKSESFFFFTDNKAFVLKTLKKKEKDLLFNDQLLENYYVYMKSNKKSFLSKFYGIYSIKMENMEEITCYIMNNLVGLDFADVTRIYDLKGSKLGRKVNLNEVEQ